MTLYRRQQTKPSQREKTQESKVVLWGGLTNRGKKRTQKQGRKGKVYPTKHRFSKNSTDRQKGLLQWTVYKTRRKQQKEKDWRSIQENWRCQGNILHKCEVAQSCTTLCDPMDGSPPGSSLQGDSPGKNTGVGCHALLMEIFPTQESNLRLLCLLHWRVLHH